MEKELRLIITTDCNYNCYFCHGESVNKSKSLLDSDDYLFLVKACQKFFGWDSVTLTGGEPLINKECLNIAKKIYNIGIRTTIVSNGELVNLNPELFNYVKRLNVSIHSLNEEIYSKITQKKNKLEKVINNLTELRNKNKDLDIRINTTIVRNLNDTSKEYDDLISFAENIRASIKIIELFSDNKKEIVPMSEIQKTLYDKGFKLKKQNLFKNILTNGKIDIHLSKIFCAMATEYYDPNTFCNSNNDLFITPDGKIKLCRYNNETIDILAEIKTRNINSLKEKFLLVNNVLGKACPFYDKSINNSLAINGGTPILKEGEGKFIHPKVNNSLIKEVVSQLKDTISIMNGGNIFKIFEDNFAKYHNKKYGLVENSGTSAIWSLYDSINLKSGDEVICCIYNFYATIAPLLHTGAVPIFVDCDETGNIDYTKIEKSISIKTKAIMVCHMWGYPARIDKIKELADKYDLYLFEDCSHAHGGEFLKQKLGSWSHAAAFSLQGNKIITGGEGGILLTNDKFIYKNALLLGHYNARCKNEIAKGSTDYKFSDTGKGLKLRAHPLAIKIANHQFNNIESIRFYKDNYSKMFMQCIDNIDGLDYIKIFEDCKPSYYAFIIKFDEDKFKINIEDFVKILHSEGCTEYDMPKSTNILSQFALFNNPGYFFEEYSESLIKNKFPMAEKFSKQIIKVPVWYTKDDWIIVYKYCEALKKVSNAFRR